MKIIVKTQFKDTHYWKNAPIEVKFLRHPHRHVFHVEVECEVTHDDRELEFFMVQNVLDAIIKDDVLTMDESKSCEQMALVIKRRLESSYRRDFTVRIFEDGENGVEV